MSHIRSLAIGLAVLLVVPLAASFCLAATINVPTGKPTIQAAINVAVNGDVVVVAPGTYHERLDFLGKAITVRGASPADPAVVAATIVNADALGPVVSFKHDEGAASVLEGLALTNGTGVETGSGIAGGGVFCWRTSPIVRNCLIHGNTATYGGGMYTATGTPLFSGNIVRNNTSKYGAGIDISYSSPTVTGNMIFSNTATASGGGIFEGYSRVTITNNTIFLNTANGGGGIGLGEWPTPSAGVVITGNVIANNAGGTVGGGIACWDVIATITNNTISGNTASQGGGVYTGNSTVTLANSIITSATSGGGVYLASGTAPVVAYCDVFGNNGGAYVKMTDQTGTNGNLAKDPLFANATARDFRLKSTGGRFVDATASWVVDAILSPCIDAGNPGSVYANEPAPNGKRINLGYDGNTSHASMSAPHAPVVIAWTPTSSSASAERPTLTATFGTTMDKATAQAAFSVSPAQAVGVAHGWPGTFSWAGNKLMYKLSTSLDKNRTYTVKVAKTAKSTAGLTMAADKTWTFKTNGQPAVSSYAPTGTAVPRSTSGKVVKIGFNQAMNHNSAQGALWVYKTGATPPATPTRPAGAFSWVGNEMHYTFTSKLAALTSYTVKLGTGAKSSTGVSRTATFAWTFKTGGSATSPSAVTVASAPTASGAQIVVNLAAAADVTVSIRNLAGREVAVLQPGALVAGMHSLLWSGKSLTGTKCPAGMYLVQVSAKSSDGSVCSAMTALRR